MLDEKDTIKCESIFDNERTHRFWWKRVWDSKKPIACVIMLNACIADNVIMDTSTYLVVNAIANLEDYGGVIIVNLFSKLTSKVSAEIGLPRVNATTPSFVRNSPPRIWSCRKFRSARTTK